MSLHDDLLNQIAPTEMRQIAAMLGTDTPSATAAVEASLGMIVGGMARNTRDASGAASLHAALARHADRDPLADVLSGDVEGQRILSHVLGAAPTRRVAQTMSQLTGLNANSMVKLMAVLAPIVMTTLAKRAAATGMDAKGLAEHLHYQHQTTATTSLGDLITSLLTPTPTADPLTPAMSTTPQP